MSWHSQSIHALEMGTALERVDLAKAAGAWRAQAGDERHQEVPRSDPYLDATSSALTQLLLCCTVPGCRRCSPPWVWSVGMSGCT